MSKTAKINYLIKNLNKLAPGVLKSRAIKYLFENGLKFWGPSKEFFSQFGEDAFLQCYFANKSWNSNNDTFLIKPGFYVDVGAYSPINISNTYFFYKNGWRGINIDATPEVKEIFDLLRPRDLNIHAAISNEEKELLLHSWGISVYNTLSKEKSRDYIAKAGIGEPKVVKIYSVTLETILDKYLPANQPISFLSIDVEGHDLEVLQSNNWDKYRPELVLAEDHKYSIEQIVESPITKFMHEVGYKIIAWTAPTIIYKDKSRNLS